MNEKKIIQVINYKTDADGHHLSMTACPYWRMNNHGITDGALRSVTSRERAQEAYKRAMSIYRVSHNKD